MMEEKILYIAPEAQIICFAPTENIANEFWDAWGLRDTGTGGTLDGSGTGNLEGTVGPTEKDDWEGEE